MKLHGVKMTRAKIPEGELIFTEGDPSICAFLLRSGTIEIFKNINGEDRLLTEVSGEELLGEMGLIDNQPRSATLVAKTDVLVDRIEKDDFLREIEKNPRFASQVMSILVERLRNQTPAEGSPIRIETGEDISTDRHSVLQELEPGAREALDTSKAQRDIQSREVGPGDPDEPDQKDTTASGSVRPELADHVTAADGTIVLPLLIGDESGQVTGRLAQRLGKCYGLTVIGLEKQVGGAGSFHDPIIMQRAANSARQVLADKNAALLLHGIVDDPNTGIISIRLINRWLDDEGRLGGSSIYDQIELPANADKTAMDLFCAIVLCATQITGEEFGGAVAQLVPENLQAALETEAIPQQHYSKQQYARMLSMYGSVCAKLSLLTRKPVWLHESATSFNLAAQLADTDYPVELAVFRLHLAVVLSSMGERTRNMDCLRKAADSCRIAGETFQSDETPIQSITAHARLGAIYYRSSVLDCQTDSCRLGVEAFQEALAICDREKWPDQWADVMNGLGQNLQLFGRLTRNPDLMKWSIKVSISALEVRTLEHNPLGWARTQNNIGTSRYLLGSLETDADQLSLSIENFKGAEEVFHQRHQESMVELVMRNRRAAEREMKELSS